MSETRRSPRIKLFKNRNNEIASPFGAKVMENITDTYTKGIEKKLLHQVENEVVQPRRQLNVKVVKRKLPTTTNYPKPSKKNVRRESLILHFLTMTRKVVMRSTSTVRPRKNP